jgi:HD-GYP domain-containing protein (c-di-GMP phosphodiesterase class II)
LTATTPTAAALHPAVEQLVEAGRPRRGRPFARRERTAQFAVAAAFLLVAVPMAAVLPSDRSWSVGQAVALVLAYAVTSRIEFNELGAGYTVPTELVLVPMLLLLPAEVVPLLVAAGFLLGKLPDFITGRTHPERAVLALGDAWHAVGPALVISLAAAGTPTWTDWPIYLAALGAQFAGDAGASAAREWLAHGVAPRLQLRSLAWVYAIDALLAPIGLLAAFASTEQPYAFLLVLPLVGLLAVFSAEREVRLQHALALSHAHRGTALLLSDIVDDDDYYTGEHSRGVVRLALAVADRLGIDRSARRDLEFAALLHDVGKVAIPNEIIHKAGPLTREEVALVRTHTLEGHRMLQRFGGVLDQVGRIVRSCHERWDGNGYPDGLAGAQIPRASRIIFACDAFNAMTTDRSYRRARPTAEALAELRANAGTQFDPAVVEVLTSLVAEATSGETRVFSERSLVPSAAP